VSSLQTLLSTGQEWGLELSFLAPHFSLGCLSVSAHYQFHQGGGECGVVFARLQMSYPAPMQDGSTHCSAPPSPGGGEIFLLFIWPIVFLGREWGGCTLLTSCAGLCDSLQRR
jgi:hypothetical protein